MRLEWNLLGVLHSGPSTWIDLVVDWGLKWLGWRGGRHITPLHMISPIVGPGRQRLFSSYIKL